MNDWQIITARVFAAMASRRAASDGMPLTLEIPCELVVVEPSAQPIVPDCKA